VEDIDKAVVHLAVEVEASGVEAEASGVEAEASGVEVEASEVEEIESLEAEEREIDNFECMTSSYYHLEHVFSI
jgi:hypothetical protein